jgi:hypothetical protein
VDELSPYFTGLIQLVSDSEGGTENLLHYDSYAAERFPYTYGSLPSNLIYDTPLGVFLIPYSENYGIWGYYFLTTQYVFLDGGSDLDPYPFPGSSGPAIDPGPFPGLGGAPGLKKWMCDCPDFSLKEPATGRFASEQGARDWSSSNAGSGRVGNEQQFCKHIHSVRASLNLPANVSAEDWKVMENWKEYVDQALRNRAQHRKRKRRRGKGGSDAAYKRYQRWLDRTARRGGLSREERKQRDARRKQERKAVDQAFKQRQDAKVRRQAEKRAIDQRANNYRDRYVRGESIDSIIQDAKRTNNQKAFDQFYKGVS